MVPTQIARLNVWGPILAFVTSCALTAGIAYGIMGSDVSRNSTDIAALQAQGTTITDIRIAQGVAKTERRAITQRLDRITRILESQYGVSARGLNE